MINGTMQFCSDCGYEYSFRASACPKCGCPSDYRMEQKDRITYILFGIFLGGFGIHNFYAGESCKGGIKLLLLLFSWLIIPAIISGIWTIIEVCTVKADANGVPFK